MTTSINDSHPENMSHNIPPFTVKLECDVTLTKLITFYICNSSVGVIIPIDLGFLTFHPEFVDTQHE